MSLDVAIEAVSARERASARGGFLFTHRGYSGPSVLDISHVAVRSQWAGAAPASVRVAWTDLDRAAWTRHLSNARGLVVTAVAAHVPQRLAKALVRESQIAPSRSCAQMRREERE